jgi:hypothetical protein
LIAEHVPSAGPSHASHWPVQRELQHTPSTHVPEMHSASALHAEPFVSRHCPLPAPALAGAHCEPLAHLETAQQTPSTQKPLVQSAAVEHASPRPGSGMHAPDLHRKPAAQSRLLAHPVLHAAVSH